MKCTKLLVVAALATMLAGTAFAADGKDREAKSAGEKKEACARACGHCSGHGGHGLLIGAYHLESLTADQRKQLDALLEQQRQKMEEGAADREALQNALDKGADEATLRPLAEKEGRHVTDMIMQQVAVRAQLEKILTKEQFAQLNEMGGKAEKCERHKPMRERM